MRRAALLVLLALARTATAEPYVDAVVSHTVGTGGGGREADLPGVVLGPPRGSGAFQGSLDVFSLGRGGSIVVAFEDNVVVDRPGPDFTIFENAFLSGGTTTTLIFSEPGTVSVSADGVRYVPFPCRLDDPPYFPGCAGVYPVFANADDPLAPSPFVPSSAPVADMIGVPIAGFTPPPGSGGDTFDLADVGLAAIRYLRIDASDLRNGLAGLAGFDLDAVAALHSVDVAGQPDGDGDGFPDAADSCPAVANPEQVDGDADGVGDACESTPPPDTDGDGVPDGTDGCPDVFDPDQADADHDGVGDACDGCPAVPDPAQIDTDRDGVGDACEPAPPPPPDADGDGVPDAADDCPTVADLAQTDTDGDGPGDACDPCPADPTCAPLVPPRFPGGGNAGPADALLSLVVPTAATTILPAGARSTTLVLVVAPDVVPGSVRVRLGKRLLVDPADVVPGSTKTITIPIGRKRTVVRLRATGPLAGRRRLNDGDRLTLRLP